MHHCPTGCNGQVLNTEPPLKPRDAVYAILLTPEWEEHICATLTPSQRLAEEAQAQQACLSRSALPGQYKDFADVFLQEAFAHLPPHKAWDHAIDLHHDAKLPRGRTFPLSPAEQKELDEFLRENLANRHICLSKSLIRAPVFFVKKKEGSLHLVQDYWKLNEITIKNSYPLPLVSNVLTRLWNGSPPWTSTGASTMSVSKKEMSGRQPSPQTQDSLSRSSCSLDYATHPPPSRP